MVAKGSPFCFQNVPMLAGKLAHRTSTEFFFLHIVDTLCTLYSQDIFFYNLKFLPFDLLSSLSFLL